MCCFFSRWALKWLRTWKTAWTGTSSTCCQPFVRSAGRAFGVSWWSRGWRYPSTWRCTHLPSAGFCSASPTEPQRYRKTQDSLYELLLLMVLFYTSLCYISIIASADRNDGEMQEAGKQVSVFTNIKVKSPKNSKTDVWQRDLMCDFFLSCVFPIVLYCWIQLWGHSGLSSSQPEPLTLSGWLKTVMKLASQRSVGRWRLIPQCWLVELNCKNKHIIYRPAFSICCSGLWVVVWPVPTLQNLKGWLSWTRPGRSSPRSAVHR